MTQAHLHLILNHLPILGTIFGLILLIVGLLKKQKVIQSTGLFTLVIASLLIFPAFYTGEAAEHATERIVGSSHDMLEEHEELGEKAIWASGALGVLSLALIVVARKNPEKDYTKMTWMVVGYAAIVVFLLFLVGSHGGKIRRPELRGEVPTKMDSHRGEHH